MRMINCVVAPLKIHMEWADGTRATIITPHGAARIEFSNGSNMRVYNSDIEQLIDTVLTVADAVGSEIGEGKQ